MPILRLLEDQAFSLKDVEALTVAYERAHALLSHADRSDPLMVELVAKLIVEFAHQGERNPTRLNELVSECLG